MIVLAALAGTVIGGCVGFFAAALVAGRGRSCQWCDEPDREVLGQ